jgi:hypothetical protein
MILDYVLVSKEQDAYNFSRQSCRTVVASELESTDVRPLPVLWRTQQYLLGLLDDPEFSFDVVHNFLFDRTRAIRQELGMQRVLDPQTITIHEEVVSSITLFTSIMSFLGADKCDQYA